jgi:hypothetical protein
MWRRGMMVKHTMAGPCSSLAFAESSPTGAESIEIKTEVRVYACVCGRTRVMTRRVYATVHTYDAPPEVPQT